MRCGSRQGSSRIVGGSAARVNSWPWQAMLVRSSGGQFCGGTLIDRYWIVTAAHCVSGKSPSSIKIKLGAHNRTSGSVGTEQEINVHRIIPHQNYNSITYGYDIALIQLSTPANLGVGIGLACMPDFSHSLPFDNLQKKCWITGWGTLSSGGNQPNTLMEARIPLVSKERCDVSYPGKIDNTMLCAGFDSGGVDTCQGDSGGPLVCEFNNTWYLEGVTSWGYGCAYARKYGVYAYVRNFKGWLLQNMYQVIPDPTVVPHNQSINTLVWCHFDHGLCSDWNQSTSDDFDWTLYHGSTPSSSTGPTAGQGGSGYYMFIEASSPRKTGDKAKLVASVPSNGKKACLSFYYHLYGVAAGTLNVYSGSDKVFNISGNQGNYWIMVERNIRLDGSVTFEGIVGSSYTGDIAIDSVNITNGSCPVSCNFDNGLCFGWTQSKSDVFDWTLRSGSTPSWSTGPSAGHGGSGKYMYIMASSWSRGSNAKLEMAVPRNKTSCCLVFYYHMYGAAMGTLNVFNGNKNIFTKSGNQGNYWNRVSRTVYFTDLVTFEGIRGSSSTSDIAIDDVSIRDGSCPGCGDVLNKSSGQLSKQNGGDEGELRCNWTIGHAGVSQAFAIFTLERVYMRYCKEYLKIFNMNGNEIFTQAGCGASLPYGTVLEVPFGGGSHLSLNLLLEYRWSAVTINYIIQRDGFDSAEILSSWYISVSRITVSSASIYWPSFPLSAVVTHYLIRYKEASNGVSRLFRANNYNNWHNANRLRGFTNYTVQVLAVTRNNGNVTYASNPVYFQTLEGVPSRAPTNVKVEDQGLNKFEVTWDPVPREYINGRLLGYKVSYKRTSYYYRERIVDSGNPDITRVVLPNMQTGEQYQMSVTAYTSRGQGPRSSYIYITKGCEGSVNQSSGWLNFTQSSYNSLNCSVQISNAGVDQGVALIAFQNVYLTYCSEFIKIYDGDGAEVFRRRGCDFLVQGSSVEIPFNNKQRISLAVFLSRRYHAAKVHYSVLHKSLSIAQEVPTWNVTIYRITSSSLSVRWTNFPLNFTVQGFLIKYTLQNSNVSQVFQASKWHNTHYSGSVLKGYSYYEVKVIAVVITGNGTSMYSTRASLTRTNEGVPSIAPTNVRVSNLQLGEVKVQWNHIPQQNANGRLVGYRVYYHEYPYWYGLRTVNSSGPNDTMLVFRGLKAGHYYRISVAALTRVGAGPQSSWWYITTGCRGHVNRSFGQLQIGRNRGSSYLSCSFVIGNIGISQGVAPIWIQDLYLASYYGEYVKITDGNGTLVFSHYGYATFARKKFLEVDFGSKEQITIQINLTSSSSHLNLHYGIVKQSIFSALPVVNWNVTVSNITANEMTIHWQNLASLVNDNVPYYVALVNRKNGSQLSSVAVSGSKNLARLFALPAYTSYQVNVVGIDSGGQSHSSSNVTARTDEGVPSRRPSNIRLLNVRAGEVKVQWDALSQQYINGRLLGYTVYYEEYPSYSYLRQSVNTSSVNVYLVILRGMKAAQRYRINVAAYTSKGVGPQSYSRYITTGCGGNLNQSFGQLKVGRRSSYSYLRCNWAIGNVGISQAVALVSLQELYLGSSRDYIKVIDGNGRTVLSRYGYPYAPQKPFVEAPYGNAGSISVQIYLYRYSRFKLQFGILKQGLQSAQLVANWSSLISNTTTTSLQISWQNLTQVVGQRILHFIVVIKTTNGTTLNGNIRSEQTFSDVFFGLSPYTEYRLSVVGVDEQGTAYKHNELTAWTDESVPSRAPSYIFLTDVESTRIKVTWNPLPRQYHNGRLLGYKVYFRKTAYYSNPQSESSSSSITICNPNATNVTLTGLMPGQRYDVSVAAFTSKGIGPRSYRYYVTTVCLMTVNQSVGLIDVMQADYNALHCHWTIGNVGIPQAVALFIIRSINFSHRSEYVKIFDGNATLQYHYNSCSSFKRGLIIEIPFLESDNITVSIYLNQLQKSMKARYVVLRSGLSSAPLLSGWKVTVENTSFSSIHIRWTNLTSLLNRQVRHYIAFLNMNNGSALSHKITDGRELATEVTGLKPSSNYTVQVFGIAETGQPYRTVAEDARTKKISCGYRPSGSSRIVGGTVVTVNSWPWQAMLRDVNGRQFCGGSLIHPQWVLTATHCVSGKSPSSVKVRLGAHYRLSASVGTEQDFDVTQKIQHESYYTPKRWSNDVALLKLSRPAELGNGVGLVCLSNEKFQLPFNQPNKTCWISGWGTLYYYGPQPTELMQVNLPMISWQRCNALYYPGKVDSSMLCVGRSQGGVGACHGDSGGPLVCEFNNQWYLEGVTSWGGLPCAATGKPTVYANVRNLKSWIISKMTSAPLPSPVATPLPTSSSASCGSVVNNRLRSPRYPSNYPNSMSCVYRVPIPCNKDLNIYFYFFSLVSHYSCSYDYLQITNDRNQVIGKYCGVRSGLSLIVAGSYVDFRFRSDGSVTRKGFDLGLYFVSAPTSGSSNRTTAEPQTTTDPPTTSESSTSAVQTPSLEQKNKSAVMLRVSGLDIKKWDQKMKDAFKTQVASAATKHCAVDVAQCQVAQTRSRRRRSSGMIFTPDMVHILPGYPKESPDDPEITLLAFYLSLAQGVSGGTVVNKDVLQDIVKSDMSGIGQSMDSTIDSVEPVETTPDKIQQNNEDEKEDKESKPTSLIIGASVGGIVFIALVAVFIMVCKRSQRLVRTANVDKKEDLDSHATNSTNATPRESLSNSTQVRHDHPGSAEQAVEMEEQDTPPSSVKQTHRQSLINTASFQHSKSPTSKGMHP